MLYIVIGFLLVVVLVQFAFRHPTSGIDAVATWRDLQKNLSVKLAVLDGFLGSAVPVMEKLNDALPQLSTIQALHGLTSSTDYQTFCAVLAFAIPLARQWRQGSLQTASKDPAENEKH